MNTETLNIIRDQARKFTADRLAPHADARDRNHIFPRSEMEEMGRLGWMGMLVSEAVGGSGGTNELLCAITEEIAAGDLSCSTVLSSHNTLVCPTLLEYGSDRVQAEILPKLASGVAIGGFSLTEPGSGSDAFSLSTVARREGDEWILNGTKQFVTCGRSADWMLVFARSDEPLEKKPELSCFLVSTATPGYRVVRTEETLGLHGAETCQVAFEDVRVPTDQIVGARGQGREMVGRALVRSRVGIAAQAVGAARAALEYALGYAEGRVAFGKPIITHQAVAHRLASMATDIHAARALTYQAARLLDEGRGSASMSSMAKLFAADAAERVVREAMQVLGGYGYLRDYPLERIYRDVRVCSVYEGTSDILKTVICNELILERRT